MTINELITKAHTQAKSMGWWDEERNTGELLMLIVSECGEALEAHRNGNRANDAEYMTGMALYAEDNKKLGFGAGWPMKAAFERYIKDTFEDELADIVIRIADWMGANGWTQRTTPQHSMVVSDNVGEVLYAIDRKITNNQLDLCDAMDRCFSLANKHSIDLWRHIELKLAYNLTRGHKHGKAY